MTHTEEHMDSVKRVLIVDDNTLAANAMVRLLNALGWEAIAAFSAKHAQEFLSESTVDLILLDIGMPEMDGYELVGILRDEFALTIPIIALTGYGLGDDRDRAHEAGFTAHLTKPIGMRELQETLLGLLV